MRFAKKYTVCIVAAIGLFEVSLYSYFPINVFRPFDSNRIRPLPSEKKWGLGVTSAFGFGAQARRGGKDVDVLRTWQDTQSTLAMVKGFPTNTHAGQIAQQFTINDDDGVRGHMKPTGSLSVDVDASVYVRHAFSSTVDVGVYVPFYKMQLKNVSWKDQTMSLNAADVLAKDLLTDTFETTVKELGGPSVKGWQRTGIGDIWLLGQWRKTVEQERDQLKAVTVGLRGGLSIPTGLKKDEDAILSVPFGADGGFGLVMGGGIDTHFWSRLTTGVDVEGVQLFGSARTRRIKTDVTQGDVVLLAKTHARKNFGFTFRFDLHAKLRFFAGFSACCAYQHWKHLEDTITITSNDYSNSTANTALELEEWTMHQIIGSVHYDFPWLQERGAWGVPSCSLYCKIPFKGQRSILTREIGLSVGLSF